MAQGAIVNSHDTERAYVQGMLEIQQARLDQARADMQAQIDAFRTDSAARHAEMIREHQERVRQHEADRQAWFARLIDGDEPAQEPAQHRSQDDAHATPGPGTVGAGRPNPHAVELERAEDIRDMSMAEYAARRAEFGIRSRPTCPDASDRRSA